MKYNEQHKLITKVMYFTDFCAGYEQVYNSSKEHTWLQMYFWASSAVVTEVFQ